MEKQISKEEALEFLKKIAEETPRDIRPGQYWETLRERYKRYRREHLAALDGESLRMIDDSIKRCEDVMNFGRDMDDDSANHSA